MDIIVKEHIVGQYPSIYFLIHKASTNLQIMTFVTRSASVKLAHFILIVILGTFDLVKYKIID